MSVKKISLFFLAPLLLLGIFVLFSTAQASAPDHRLIAQTTQGNYGLDEASQNTPLIDNTPQQIVGTVIGAALSLLGVIFFLLIIYGGLRWMLAQGNEQEVEKAKEVLIAAVIGLIIVLSAYAITTFIGTQLTGGK